MNNSDFQLLRPKQVCQMLGGIHISTLYRWMDEGKFDVEKQRLSNHAVCFRKSEVIHWAEQELSKNSQSNLEPAVQ